MRMVQLHRSDQCKFGLVTKAEVDELQSYASCYSPQYNRHSSANMPLLCVLLYNSYQSLCTHNDLIRSA